LAILYGGKNTAERGIDAKTIMGSIHIIHENPQWIEPLEQALREHGLPFKNHDLQGGSLSLGKAPEPGVYFSKMSASSHLRDHVFSPGYAFALLTHLEAHGMRVINGSNALRLEISKCEQSIRLREAGIRVPEMVACFGLDAIMETAQTFQPPFILKPNRGGKGVGVKLFRSHAMLESYLSGARTQDVSVDNITLIQEYVEAAEPYITRLEFVGGRFVYAVRVDTSQGFELCPAEACRVKEPLDAGTSCALDAEASLFQLIEKFDNPLINQLELFLRHHGIEVAGVEFIRDRRGQTYVYDINTNTNYSPHVECHAHTPALGKLVSFLGRELRACSPRIAEQVI
jgi:glutathione synthase/RimK-type ligase-like ATP-grasp enzyme